MKKILVIVGIGLANFWAGVVVLVGLMILEAVRAVVLRRTASPFDRVKPTAAQRERFELELQEEMFRVGNVGPTVIKRQEA